MNLQDILLHIDTYPEPTSDAAIDAAVDVAALLGAQITALALRLTIPVKSNMIAEHLIGLTDLAREEEARSLAAATHGLDRFKARAESRGVFRGVLLETTQFANFAQHVAQRARARDLCIVPVGGALDGQNEVAETLIFHSGRPVLLMRREAKVNAKLAGGVAVLAWDGSVPAAQAMADALPILRGMRQVRVLTIVNEKASATAGLAQDAARHLQAHGVETVIDEVDAKGEFISRVLDSYLARTEADLMVMGAYGRSRLREVILGGATEHMLRRAQLPVLMSH
ncbi:MAG: universal stress protein [Phenylobacterium sp.]|uniref:universal stress protein n=1 Tax=Phenylobacterium sp. TaxID=1871053 RepID=UPI001B74BB77|nr:universal stress protein [Phenylobacterium sp.]MBP7814910.1 universal stress protein [Phenylobacterium sp.]MBP9230964.1 universal stress protein [Phenylobacterium sp.]MBP9754499.1 universal stress protein [Phenylobacterium sp.]